MSDQSIFTTHKEEHEHLNCPKVGDRWSELMANQTYVCAIDEMGVKVLFLWGGGRNAYLFETVGDFQEWLMYDTPVHRLTGFTWANFIGNEVDHCMETPTWESQWVDQAKDTGVENPKDE